MDILEQLDRLARIQNLVPITICAFLIILAITAIKRPRGPKRWSRRELRDYNIRSSLMTRSELVLWHELRRAVPPGFAICPKPRLEDFISVRKGLKRAQRLSRRGRIKSRHVDFLIIREGSGTPLIAIELDGPSHSIKSQRAADRFKDDLFNQIALPLKRIRVGSDYIEEVQQIYGSL